MQFNTSERDLKKCISIDMAEQNGVLRIKNELVYRFDANSESEQKMAAKQSC